MNYPHALTIEAMQQLIAEREFELEEMRETPGVVVLEHLIDDQGMEVDA